MNPDNLLETPSQKEPEISKILDELSTPAHLEDIPRHIDLCKRSLELVSPNNSSLWAALQNELGNSLARSPIGNRADNIEQAIDHYRLALKVYTQQDFPTDWAMTQNNMANAYKNRIRGNRADNIEQAIHLYGLALKVRTEEDFPADWAMTQNNMANAYKNRIRGNRADNIEQAIHLYGLAFKVRTEEDFPVNWGCDPEQHC